MRHAPAEIAAAVAATVAHVGLTREQVMRYQRHGRLHGYTDPLEALAAVIIATAAPRGRRGRKARDPIIAAIERESPRQTSRHLAGIRAAIRRAALAGGQVEMPV